MSVNVQLNTFEGPMALLLYLIKKNEMNIYDIPIHEITEQYLEYIRVMKELNLEVAGEFVAMASTLILIKSRMLVPQYDENGEEVQVDPRKELVQKLLEYQKFQEASKVLYRRPLINRDVWLRGSKDPVDAGPEVADEIILDDKGLFALISAFRDLMRQVKSSPHQVSGKGMSISAHLNTICHKFRVGERIEFRDLLGESFTKTDLIITFLCILELCRLQYIKVYQSDPLSTVYIDTIKQVTQDITNRLQEYDAENTEAKAEAIMAQAELELESQSMASEAEALVDVESLETDKEIIDAEAAEIL